MFSFFLLHEVRYAFQSQADQSALVTLTDDKSFILLSHKNVVPCKNIHHLLFCILSICIVVVKWLIMIPYCIHNSCCNDNEVTRSTRAHLSYNQWLQPAGQRSLLSQLCCPGTNTHRQCVHSSDLADKKWSPINILL